MIRLTDLTLARGANRLLEGASMTVHPGHRVGIIGPNGSGKSSLFALLRGEIHQDAGTVDMPPRWTIAHVAQETPAVERAALDFVLDGDVELREVEAALAREEQAHAADGHALAELHHRYEEIGGYAARARASELLAGLGVVDARHADPVASFSGGWRMRLNLAQALAARSDLLLLDEPTNHLDLDAVLWLEDWLKRYPGTLLLVTHDRDFLDAVAQSIVHVDGDKLRTYTGNYSAFERERAAQLALQQSAFAKQQRQIEHLQSFVDRFRAKATKAKQAQSRLRTLERMERIAPAHVDSPFEFAFAPSGTHARQLVRLEHATLRYGSAPPILDALELSILAGDRIGLLGPNGAGKSTLVKALAGELALAHGTRHVAQNLVIGYFAQHQLEQLDLEASPMLHLARLDPGAREQELRNFLGGFDFRGDMVSAPVERFSGGEKARLVLALIVRRRPQLLILDEPTNHLDIEMREALAEALQDFDGALGRRRARPPPPVRDDRHAAARQRRTRRAFRRRPRRLPRLGARAAAPDGHRCRARRRTRPQGGQARRGPGAPEARRRAETPRREARQARGRDTRARGGEARARHLARRARGLRGRREGAPQVRARALGEIAWELARREAGWLEVAEALDRIDAPG
jgi:ATP-binding cassette subfamily F protein 3